MADGNDFPQLIFLQNHGVFVSANSTEEIDHIYNNMFKLIKSEVLNFPDTLNIPVAEENVTLAEKAIGAALGEEFPVSAFANKDILTMSASNEAFAPLELAMTPDHIVYYGFKPVYADSLESLENDISVYIREYEVTPRLAVVKGIGAFAFDRSLALAERAKKLFLDDVKVAVYTESFGRFQFMPQDQIDFIRNWEVEKYRFSLSK